MQIFQHQEILWFKLHWFLISFSISCKVAWEEQGAHQIIQLFLFSLCYVDLYVKIPVELVLEGIEFALQLNREMY